MRKSRRVFSEAQTRVMQFMVAHAKPQPDYVLFDVIQKPHSGNGYGADRTRRTIQPRMTLSSLVRKGMIDNENGMTHRYALTPAGREVARRYALRGGE